MRPQLVKISPNLSTYLPTKLSAACFIEVMINRVNQGQSMRFFMNSDHITRLCNYLVMSITCNVGLSNVVLTNNHFELATTFDNDWPTTQRMGIERDYGDGI